MLLKTLLDDEFTIAFLTSSRGLEAVNKHNNTFRLPGGGTKVVGVWSLLPEDMPLNKKRKVKRWTISPQPRDTDIPEELNSCDLFMILNRSVLRSLQEEARHIIANLQSATREQIPKHLKTRGGGVAYWQLPGDRVVTPSVLQTPGAGSVHYGTSALANIAELIQTLKIASHLGLPAVFDTYGTAYKVEHTMVRLMTSLEILTPNQPVGPATLSDFIHPKMWGLKSYLVVCNEIGLHNFGWKGSLTETLDESYRDRQFAIALRLMEATNQQIDLKIIPAEEGALLMDQRIGILSSCVRNAAGHKVRFLYSPDGNPIYSDQTYPLSGKTLQQVHDDGYWAGGSLLYYSAYRLGGEEGRVCLIYDGAKGGVHLMSKPWLEEPYRLWVAPVGSFGIHPTGSNIPIDPYVFEMLLDRWGPDKSRQVLCEIWDACEAPLAPENIGKNTRVEVGLDGIEVVVTQP